MFCLVFLITKIPFVPIIMLHRVLSYAISLFCFSLRFLLTLAPLCDPPLFHTLNFKCLLIFLGGLFTYLCYLTLYVNLFYLVFFLILSHRTWVPPISWPRLLLAFIKNRRFSSLNQVCLCVYTTQLGPLFLLTDPSLVA